MESIGHESLLILMNGEKRSVRMLANTIRFRLIFILAASFLSGCVTDGGASRANIQIISSGSELDQGPLHPENIAIGGIYLGDTQEDVLKKLGEPTEKGIEHSTPFPQWYYKDLNMYISFYTDGSPNGLVGGVVRIVVNHPSTDQTKTNYGFGVGDQVSLIQKSFPRIFAYSPRDGTQTFSITGDRKKEDRYDPTLLILAKNDVIDWMVLSNEESQP
jgi:hypothetical protein